MGRVLAIDYGTRRVGLAVTDPECIIASPLETVSADKIMEFLQDYVRREPVDVLVVGMPTDDHEKDTDATGPVKDFIRRLEKHFTGLKIVSVDESYTSSMARDAMIRGGTKKKYRQQKANVDRISATLILQSYLEQQAL